MFGIKWKFQTKTMELINIESRSGQKKGKGYQLLLCGHSYMIGIKTKKVKVNRNHKHLKSVKDHYISKSQNKHMSQTEKGFDSTYGVPDNSGSRRHAASRNQSTIV